MKLAPSCGRPHDHVDVPAGRRELDGVADEVAQHLPQPRRVVGLDDRLVGQVRPQLHALALGHRLGVIDRVLGHRPQILLAQLQGHQAGVELGQLQQVGRQPVESLHLLATAAQELLARLGLLGGALEQQLVERPQRRDGRAQLVADVGQELTAAVAVLADDGDRLLQSSPPCR